VSFVQFDPEVRGNGHGLNSSQPAIRKLDEVGELSARAQAKLLRTLQEGEIRRIGENFTRPIDARLIAATNRSLASETQAGRFRQDLLYRLDVIRITVPPLRERVEDIPLLASRFWQEAAGRIGSNAVLGQAALAALARYDWPGNVPFLCCWAWPRSSSPSFISSPAIRRRRFSGKAPRRKRWRSCARAWDSIARCSCSTAPS
jgi:hypothetical protein